MKQELDPIKIFFAAQGIQKALSLYRTGQRSLDDVLADIGNQADFIILQVSYHENDEPKKDEQTV